MHTKGRGDAHKKEGGMHTKLLKSCSTSLFVMHHVVRRHARLCCSIGLLLSRVELLNQFGHRGEASSIPTVMVDHDGLAVADILSERWPA